MAKLVPYISSADQGRETLDFFGSDIISDQAEKVVGNVFLPVVTCDSEGQLNQYAEKLADGGKVLWLVAKSNWGFLFGHVVDQFGHQWMLDYNIPSENAS